MKRVTATVAALGPGAAETDLNRLLADLRGDPNRRFHLP